MTHKRVYKLIGITTKLHEIFTKSGIHELSISMIGGAHNDNFAIILNSICPLTKN